MSKESILGWISLHRKIKNHWLYPTNENRKFTKYEAWQDLLLTASHREFKHIIDGNLVIVPIGCLVITEISLSNRWQWCRETVKKFLKMLEEDNMISLKKINPKSKKSCTLAKITNYEDYQDNSSIQTALKTTKELKSEIISDLTHNNNRNKKNNINKGENEYLEYFKEVV